MRVGHVLRVDDEELFPADLLCLYSALPDNACFIKTTNLDGESNLKIRRPVDLREAAPEEGTDVMHIQVPDWANPGACKRRCCARSARQAHTASLDPLALLNSVNRNRRELSRVSKSSLGAPARSAHLQPVAITSCWSVHARGACSACQGD